MLKQLGNRRFIYPQFQKSFYFRHWSWSNFQFDNSDLSTHYLSISYCNLKTLKLCRSKRRGINSFFISSWFLGFYYFVHIAVIFLSLYWRSETSYWRSETSYWRYETSYWRSETSYTCATNKLGLFYSDEVNRFICLGHVVGF